jgi:peptidyl-prolyl cis-trans isomerase-like 4
LRIATDFASNSFLEAGGEKNKMSVLLVTSVGDLVFDLYVDQCPVASENFLKLCTIKYYNNCLIYNLQPNLLLQTGDPTGTGKGGNSIFGIMEGKKDKFFSDEINSTVNLKTKIGYLGMAHLGDVPNANLSQFFITLRTDDMDHIKKKYTIFGELAEGDEALYTLNELPMHPDYPDRPLQDVRILHTYVLDDPFPNSSKLRIPDSSPLRERPPEETVKAFIPYEPPADPNHPSTSSDGRTEEEIMESIRKKEAQSRAIVLEMTGDLPDAEVKPPEEVLFVCKLNPVTRDEDLELIFSRFGKIKSCEIIRDFKTGDSLNYAFIEFEKEESCIEAYEKMNNVLIDDRRIKVDFSQSVSTLWNRYLLKPRKNPGKKAEEPSHYQPKQEKPTKDLGMIESKGEANYKKNNSEPTRKDHHAENDRRKEKDRRSHSRERRKDDRRDRDHNSRDRDKDRRERSGEDRDRYRDRGDKRDRSPNDRSRPSERKRESSRDRERGKDRDRERSREKRGDYHRTRSRSPERRKSNHEKR